MKDDTGTLLTLAGYFALMSLFAIGGANSAVPEMQRVAVEVERWMTERQFTDIFAIAQVTPGPNVIIVTLIGYHVAGLLGALVATLAMCGPTCVFAFYVGHAWERFKDAPWRAAIQAGSGPDLDWSHRRQRLRGGRGGGAQFCGSDRHAGHRDCVLHDAVESPVDFRRGGSARARRSALNLNLPGCFPSPIGMC